MSWLQPDGRKLLAARALRTFGYGYLAVALGLYLQQLGLSAFQVGWLQVPGGSMTVAPRGTCAGVRGALAVNCGGAPGRPPTLSAVA